MAGPRAKFSVMAGLDPGHPDQAGVAYLERDARDKPGHDNWRVWRQTDARRIYLRRSPHAARTRQGGRIAARGDRAQSRGPDTRRGQGPQQARPRAGRRRRARLRRSGRRGRRRHRARGGARCRVRRRSAGRADQPFLRVGAGRSEFRGGPGDVWPARDDDRGRCRIHEPYRHRRFRRRLAGRSVDCGDDLFSAAGHFRRPDRDEVRIFTRRRRCLCGRKPEARGQGLGRGTIQEFRHAGQGRQRPHHPRQGRAHAPGDDDANARRLAAVFRADGRHGGLRRGRGAALSGSRGGQPRPYAGQFLGHRRRRRRGADRQQGGGQGRGPQAARAHPPVRQYRLRALDHADRAYSGQRKSSEKSRHDQARYRPVGAQRGLRLGGAALHAGAQHFARQDERERRRHRHGPSARRHRRHDPRHRARRARAARQGNRADHALHRCRHGHRDDYRTRSRARR